LPSRRRSLGFATEFIRGFYGFNALVILACCFVFCAQRFVWRRRKRLGKRNPGFFPTYTAAGNALQVLQAITQQRAEYVFEEKFDDEADDDDEGEPCDPTKHLKRQLKRIGQGETIERLTVLRPQRRIRWNAWMRSSRKTSVIGNLPGPWAAIYRKSDFAGNSAIHHRFRFVRDPDRIHLRRTRLPCDRGRWFADHGCRFVRRRRSA
jgi:hypothetical protein